MREDALRRRTAIIEAASSLFQKHGNEVSLETIARHAGVGIATLYRNFPDRGSLVRAAAIHLGTEFLAFQQKLINKFETDGNHPKKFVRAYADKLLSMGMSALIPAFAPSDLDSLDAELLSIRDQLQRTGERFIKLAQQRGVLGPGVTHLQFVVGLLALARPRKVAIDGYEPDIQDKIIDIYLAGLKVGHLNPTDMGHA